MSQLLFQQKLQQRRVVEERTEDLQRFIAKDKTLKENFKSDDRAVVNRTIREQREACLLYTSPSPRDRLLSRMPSSA